MSPIIVKTETTFTHPDADSGQPCSFTLTTFWSDGVEQVQTVDAISSLDAALASLLIVGIIRDHDLNPCYPG